MHAEKEVTMMISHFQRFLDEATIPDPESDPPLGPDCLYGLYTSWCLLHRISPVSDIAFRAGMRSCGIDIHHIRLEMTGPAAANYILASYPGTE
jgi:hypothetical protein